MYSGACRSFARLIPRSGIAFFLPASSPTERPGNPPRSDVLRGVEVLANAVMLLPHTCDFYGPEKERTHRDRLVGRIQATRGGSVVDSANLISGEGYAHTFFVPFWNAPTDSARDLFEPIAS